MSSLCLDHRIIESFRFALIDASLRETLPSHWAQVVVAPGFLGDDTARCPALVDLTALMKDEFGLWCDTVQQQVIDRAETQASLLLSSQQPIHVVATHLGRRMAIKVPGHSRPMQWRFFDPGTFLQLPPLLGNPGLAWLLGPVDAVRVPWAGQWTELANPGDPRASGFQLMPLHISALLRIGVINRVLASKAAPKDVATWVSQARAIDAYVLQGQEQHGLTRQADLVSYAVHADTVHPAIHTHPRLQTLLQRLQQAGPEDELDYQEVTGGLEPADWVQMASELNDSVKPEIQQP